MRDIPNPRITHPIIRAHDAGSVPRPRLAVAADRSPAAAEILFQHLLLLLPSFVFLFFNPYP